MLCFQPNRSHFDALAAVLKALENDKMSSDDQISINQTLRELATATKEDDKAREALVESYKQIKKDAKEEDKARVAYLEYLRLEKIRREINSEAKEKFITAILHLKYLNKAIEDRILALLLEQTNEAVAKEIYDHLEDLFRPSTPSADSPLCSPDDQKRLSDASPAGAAGSSAPGVGTDGSSADVLVSRPHSAKPLAQSSPPSESARLRVSVAMTSFKEPNKKSLLQTIKSGIKEWTNNDPFYSWTITKYVLIPAIIITVAFFSGGIGLFLGAIGLKAIAAYATTHAAVTISVGTAIVSKATVDGAVAVKSYYKKPKTSAEPPSSPPPQQSPSQQGGRSQSDIIQTLTLSRSNTPPLPSDTEKVKTSPPSPGVSRGILDVPSPPASAVTAPSPKPESAVSSEENRLLTCSPPSPA